MRYNKVYKLSDAGVQFPYTVPCTWAGIPHYPDFNPFTPKSQWCVAPTSWGRQGQRKGRWTLSATSRTSFLLSERGSSPSCAAGWRFHPCLTTWKVRRLLRILLSSFTIEEGMARVAKNVPREPRRCWPWTGETLGRDTRYWYSYTTLYLTLSRTTQPSRNVIRCAIFPLVFVSNWVWAISKSVCLNLLISSLSSYISTRAGLFRTSY